MRRFGRLLSTQYFHATGLVAAGLLFLIACLVATLFGHTPKLLVAALAILMWGIAMLVLPDREPDAAAEARRNAGLPLYRPPMLHKIVWGIAAVTGGSLGVALAFWIERAGA